MRKALILASGMALSACAAGNGGGDFSTAQVSDAAMCNGDSYSPAEILGHLEQSLNQMIAQKRLTNLIDADTVANLLKPSFIDAVKKTDEGGTELWTYRYIEPFASEGVGATWIVDVIHRLCTWEVVDIVILEGPGQ